MIKNCMKRNVVFVHAKTTIREAAAAVVKQHVGLLPVVDQDSRLIGEVGMQDLLTLELPDFVNLIADVDFVRNFGAVETTRPEPALLEQPVTKLMQPAFSVEEECGLLRAYALMVKHNLLDLPVTSRDGRLVGLASRVDLGAAILNGWMIPNEESP